MKSEITGMKKSLEDLTSTTEVVCRDACSNFPIIALFFLSSSLCSLCCHISDVIIHSYNLTTIVDCVRTFHQITYISQFIIQFPPLYLFLSLVLSHFLPLPYFLTLSIPPSFLSISPSPSFFTLPLFRFLLSILFPGGYE